MDLLGKQLSLYSLSIIGLAPSPPSSGHFCLWGLALPLNSVFRGHHAGGVAAGEEDPGHVHHRCQVTADTTQRRRDFGR